MGLIVIRIKSMHREGLGAKTFVSLYDSRFTNLEKTIPRYMKVEMNRKKQLVYFVPNYLNATRDFFTEIKLAIKTRGYEMKKGTENLLIHVGFIGRLSNNNTTNFKMCEK